MGAVAAVVLGEDAVFRFSGGTGCLCGRERALVPVMNWFQSPPCDLSIITLEVSSRV